MRIAFGFNHQAFATVEIVQRFVAGCTRRLLGQRQALGNQLIHFSSLIFCGLLGNQRQPLRFEINGDASGRRQLAFHLHIDNKQRAEIGLHFIFDMVPQPGAVGHFTV
ncbi:hypothetical protein D3C80_1630190 [compost metagenome]